MMASHTHNSTEKKRSVDSLNQPRSVLSQGLPSTFTARNGNSFVRGFPWLHVSALALKMSSDPVSTGLPSAPLTYASRRLS
ncbi:hypothetical protein BgiBS90_020581, partial [Biomphalaria glabrata]